ncbi:MAG: recombinase family protein [Pseudomonadota bacterium]
MSGRKQLRVAIYTRKSTEEGLEQDFNSLDAQREACEAFILSQKELGWKPLPKRFDDGGLSGGSLDRPALQRLLKDVKENQVDIVVVYKIDRLTRSLMDFSRIVEIFDANDVSFVSVTQQFNTSTSMGRLTLNMLLSFAQFEREVTAERIRDKIAASKKKGMWMGGMVPLGYDNVDRKLVVNEVEAETIGWLFRTYLELGSVRKLKEAADAKGILSKARKPNRSVPTGGVSLSRGHLYRILSNPIHRGCIRHGGNIYPGQHEAIIDEGLFDRVQIMLDGRASHRRSKTNVTQPHLLTGLLFDETGDRLSPTHANKKGRRYRYYISHRLMQAHRKEKDGWRLPASQIESIVLNEVTSLLRSKAGMLDLCGIGNCDPETARHATGSAASLADELETANAEDLKPRLQSMIKRISLRPNSITLQINSKGLATMLGLADDGQTCTEGDVTEIKFQIQLRRRGVEARLVLADKTKSASAIDPNLIRLLGRAYSYSEKLSNVECKTISELATVSGSNAAEISRVLPLAFLSPEIVRGIVNGRQPIELTAESLKRLDHLPISWKDQRSKLGFCA